MKVLLLPVNLASDISHKVRSLRKLGIEARGFSIAPSYIQSGENITVFDLNRGSQLEIRARKLFAYTQMWRMIALADVLHWVGEPVVFESVVNKSLLKWFDKPGVIQWMGSDIRIPEMDFDVNPYYRKVFGKGYEYTSENKERSLRTQQFSADLGFLPLEFIGLERYIDQDLFPKRFRTLQPIDLSGHEAKFPDVNAKRPLVVHAPSAPVAKGTEHVIRAVEELKKHHDFDFTLIENTERYSALQLVHNCDVFVDQLILGAHGYAVVEAMAFGKPVVCYINPEIGKDYPDDLPVVNANPDNVAEQLEVLIRDAQLRHEIGKQSRSYVEKYHDDKKIAADLVSVYEEVIELHSKRSPKR